MHAKRNMHKRRHRQRIFQAMRNRRLERERRRIFLKKLTNDAAVFLLCDIQFARRPPEEKKREKATFLMA